MALKTSGLGLVLAGLGLGLEDLWPARTHLSSYKRRHISILPVGLVPQKSALDVHGLSQWIPVNVSQCQMSSAWR